MRRLILSLLGFTGVAHLSAQDYTTVTDQHVDVDVILVSGSLSGQIHGDAVGVLPPGSGLLYDGPEGTTGLVSPGGAYSFLGVEAGETIHVWPQGGEPGRMYLGFAAESLAVGSPGTELEFAL